MAIDNWKRFRATVAGNGNGNIRKDSSLTADLNGDGTDGKDKERTIEERLWGLENFGNTCYCNSILQALYASPPFRHFVEAYPDIQEPYYALGGPIATAPISPMPSPVVAKANPFETPNVVITNIQPKEKRGGILGLGKTKSSSTASQAPKPVQPAQPVQAPVILPADPNFPDLTLFSTIQTLFHHMSSSAPHLPAAPKAPAVANGQTSVPGNNAASLPSASLVATGATTGQQPGQQGPPLLASLAPPSTPRGGGPYSAGALGRGVVRPEDVLRTVRNNHNFFSGQGQQDAHEFLGFFLNHMAEEIELIDAKLRESGQEVTNIREHGRTFIHNLFHGILVNETRCLNCETMSAREESFLDLSIDIDQHSSLTSCLRQFSHSEMLCSTNKFYCETCCGLVEAERRMRIKSLPNILGLHLKRFRQDEQGRLHKLFYRVTFPLQLRVPCTTDDTEDGERMYELFAVVVHIGNGPMHGHYVTIVRSAGKWVMCDDENVEPIEESDLGNYFGDNITGAGYVLFYQAVDLDLSALGLKVVPQSPVKVRTPEETSIEALDVPQLSPIPLVEAQVPPPATVPAMVEPIILPVEKPLSTSDSPTLVVAPAQVEAPTSKIPVSLPRTTSEPVAIESRPVVTPRVTNGGTNGFTRRDSSTSGSLLSPAKDEKSKWFSRKKKDTPTNTSSPSVLRTDSMDTKGALKRQSTAATFNTVSTTSTFGAQGMSASASTDRSRDPTPVTDIPVNSIHANTSLADSPRDLSSSMISSTSGASSSQSSSVPSGHLTTPQSTVAGAIPISGSGSNFDRKNSGRRDRTVSGSSTNSNYAGGGSLSRRLSGAMGVARSSSTVFKFRKKGKQGIDEEEV